MRSSKLTRLLITLALLPLARPAHSQSDVYWRIDPGVKTCSMRIDPSLTQGEWRTFVRQAGSMISFKPLAPAAPIGPRRFSVNVDYSITPVDQHDPAWINTFVHPDAGCPLGDRIKMPALRATYGVSRTMDVTGFWTTAPGANYGLAGGAVKYAFLKETAKSPAAAVTGSYTALTGVPDFNFSVYSVGVIASKRIARFQPFLGVRQGVAVGTETTPKVDLATETLPLTHGFLGTTWSIWKLGVAAEYDVASVNTFSLMLGVYP